MKCSSLVLEHELTNSTFVAKKYSRRLLNISYQWEGGSRPQPLSILLLRLPFDFSPHVKVFAWDKSFSFALQSFWQKPLVLVFVWFSTAAAAFRWIFLTAPLLMKGELLITKAKSCLGFLQENIMRVELRSRSK